MYTSRSDDTGKLILRLVLGGVVLLHGISKLVHGVGPIQHMLQGANLPPQLAYGALVGEVVGPVLLILGFYGRIGAALIAINMAVALALVHKSQFFALNEQGGWAIELQAMLLFTAIGLALAGPGGISVNRR